TKDLPRGTAVWHPGGSMASHYAIHCKLNNLAILTSHEPVIGEQLVPTSELPPLSLDSVLQGIGAGMSIALDMARGTASSSTALLLLALHNSMAFSGDDGFWFGAGAAVMQRLGTAALLGEARHATKRERLDRELVFEHAFGNPFAARRKLYRAQWMFTHYPWSQPSSYGGERWRVCGDALLALDEALRQFVRNPQGEHFTALSVAYNGAVNQAHNGGWWLNKFTDELTMDKAATGHPEIAARAIPVIGALRKVAPSSIDYALACYRVAQPIVVPYGEQLPLVKPLANAYAPL